MAHLELTSDASIIFSAYCEALRLNDEKIYTIIQLCGTNHALSLKDIKLMSLLLNTPSRGEPAGASMKKLLRDSRTLKWVTADGELTDNVEDAVEIRDIAHAMHLCKDHHFRKMEIVLKAEKDELDVVLPFHDVE